MGQADSITRSGAEFPLSHELTITVKRVTDNKLVLGDVIRAVEKQGYSFESCMWLYFLSSTQTFYHCGTLEDADRCFVSLDDLRGELRLKYRKIPPVAPVPAPKMATPSPAEEMKAEGRPKGRAKRTKERKIGEIIDKVAEWRKLYTGVAGPDGKVKKYTLEEAAEHVGIAKKTLDDYLLQIRAGKKYGFDFNLHREAKVGALRSFVKNHKGGKVAKGDDNNSQGDD